MTLDLLALILDNAMILPVLHAHKDIIVQVQQFHH